VTFRAEAIALGRTIRYPFAVKYARCAVGAWFFSAVANTFAAINGIIHGGFLTPLSIVIAALCWWATVAAFRGVSHAKEYEASYWQRKDELMAQFEAMLRKESHDPGRD